MIEERLAAYTAQIPWRIRKYADRHVTRPMMAVLYVLRELGTCPLPGVAKRTIRALTLDHDLIKEMPGHVFELTARGRRALKYLDTPIRQAGELCVHCGTQPRHVYPSGRVLPYCLTCKNSLGCGDKKRRHKRRLKQIAEGNIPTCAKCDQPVHYGRTSVYDYCYHHYREYQRQYQRDYMREKRAGLR